MPLLKLHPEFSGIAWTWIFILQLPLNFRAGIFQVSLLTSIIIELIQ